MWGKVAPAARGGAGGGVLILSTGAYLEKGTGLAWDPSRKGLSSRQISELSEEGLFEHMVKDLTEGYEGYEGTGVKAGIIKVAGNTSTLTAWEQKNFRVASRVQRLLHVPIATHACAGAREQMQLLQEYGANIKGTFYSHVEAKIRLGWPRARTGARTTCWMWRGAGGYVQFNNFDFDFDTPFDELVYLIDRYRKRAGHGDRIFLSIGRQLGSGRRRAHLA